MSTDYIPDKYIPFSKVKTFNHNGVKVDTIDEDGDVILTDGENYLWAYQKTEIETISFEGKEPRILSSHKHEGVMFTRYSANIPDKIIEAIEDFFNVRLISEHEDEWDEIVGGQ